MHTYSLSLGAHLCYQDFPGEKTPIVFIHGLGCAASFDYPLVANSAGLTQHRRILIDLLGSGYSDKPADFAYTIKAHAQYLQEMLSALNLQRFYLFAHSMGGAVAIELAALMAPQIGGLILSEANLDSGGGMFSQQVAAMTEKEYVRRGHNDIISLNRQGGDSSARLWSLTMAASLPVAMHRVSVSLIEGATPSWRDTLYSFAFKRTFIFGAESLPDSDYQVLGEHGIEVRVVDNAGHSMAWENPVGLAEAICAALEE